MKGKSLRYEQYRPSQLLLKWQYIIWYWEHELAIELWQQETAHQTVAYY